jgi:hypothetical protein
VTTIEFTVIGISTVDDVKILLELCSLLEVEDDNPVHVAGANSSLAVRINAANFPRAEE